MADFLIDCYFEGFCKDRKNFGSDSALCDIARSQHIFANFFANSQPYAKYFSPLISDPSAVDS
jgi:hypothetical protein